MRPGDFVSAGTMMAEVGKSGTYAPHICFTLFAPDRPNGCPVRFRGRRGGAESAATGDRCISATAPPRREGGGIRDSILRGGEFVANGVRLDPGPPLFRLPVGEAIELAGRVTEPATLVGFYIWPEGKMSEHIQTVAPSGDGQFRIEARIPEQCRGLRYWTVAITQPNGQVKFPSSTRVVVG